MTKWNLLLIWNVVLTIAVGWGIVYGIWWSAQIRADQQAVALAQIKLGVRLEDSLNDINRSLQRIDGTLYDIRWELQYK